MLADEIKLCQTPEGLLLTEIAQELLPKDEEVEHCSACGLLSAEWVLRIAQEGMRRWAKLEQGKEKKS